MKRRTMLAGAAALAATPLVAPGARAQAGKTKLVFWHAMTGANNDEINRIARDFNAAQSDVELEAIYKGTYPETLTAAIAAWRAGQAPHLVQVFEVGTGIDAGRRPGREAGLATGAGHRRQDRSGRLHPGRARLLQPGRRPHGVDAAELVDPGDVVQQGRLRGRRARPRKARRTTWQEVRRPRPARSRRSGPSKGRT